MQLAREEMKGAKERRPSNDELNNYFIESGWKEGYNTTTHWCGIFATYLLRKAGAKVHWVKGRGIHNLVGAENPEGKTSIIGPYFGRKREIKATKQIVYDNTIMVGDICVRGVGQHHFIVLCPPDEHGTFEHCVEGNYGGLDFPLLHQGKRAKNNKWHVHTYYRVA